MDVTRNWKKHDVGYVTCGPFHLFKVRGAWNQWEIGNDEGRCFARVFTLGEARAWLKANWRRLEKEGVI